MKLLERLFAILYVVSFAGSIEMNKHTASTKSRVKNTLANATSARRLVGGFGMPYPYGGGMMSPYGGGMMSPYGYSPYSMLHMGGYMNPYMSMMSPFTSSMYHPYSQSMLGMSMMNPWMFGPMGLMGMGGMMGGMGGMMGGMGGMGGMMGGMGGMMGLGGMMGMGGMGGMMGMGGPMGMSGMMGGAGNPAAYQYGAAGNPAAYQYGGAGGYSRGGQTPLRKLFADDLNQLNLPGELPPMMQEDISTAEAKSQNELNTQLAQLSGIDKKEHEDYSEYIGQVIASEPRK